MARENHYEDTLSEETYEEAYEDDEVVEELDRRAYRHRRSVRNRIIVTVTAVLLLSAVIVGGILGVAHLTASTRKDAPQAVQEEGTSEESDSSEQKIIEGPSTAE